MSAVRDFLVPDLGEGLQDATITSWAVAVGDTVVLNQVLCTVETNKAAVEIPSPYAGIVTELGGAEGQTLAVGAVLVRIAVAESATQPEPPQPKRNPVLVGYGTDEQMDATRRRAKPRVRKLAADLHVDLNGVVPSGPDGIVTRDDVLAAAPHADSVRPDSVTAVTGVQAEMARRMSVSRSEIPDAHASVHIDCTELLRVRQILAAVDEAITPFALTLRLLTIALRHHREFNATWVPSERGPGVHLHESVHLGIGVATTRGLLVPVVRDAHRMTTRHLAQEVARLVRAARDAEIKPVELHGSTFTVSNFGALGLDEGVPVINYPEAAILGMGALKPRAMVIDGVVEARPTMTLTCAFDHRVADGAGVAAFLGELRALIETPELALLEG
jgi:2-oxoisovalerate dehydrogenase E2 component (dihydrolipoyl transacylase)